MKKSRGELEHLAKTLLTPRDKNPYCLGDKRICNLKELRQNIGEFTEEMAPWVAAWIEYLGDRETAQEIKSKPSEFKAIVAKRYAEVRPYLG